jgi:hypothetical protein
MVADEIDACRLVFVDEIGTNTSFPPLYAWASKGERAYCSVPRNREPNMTLLSRMSVDGIIACRGGRDQPRGLRDICRTDLGAHAAFRSVSGDGQPHSSQRRAN